MGGGSRSSSETTSNTTQIDARSVLDQSNNQGIIAGAGAAVGSYNTTNNNTAISVSDSADRRSYADSFNTTNYTDARNLSTEVNDYSNRSFNDYSNRSVTDYSDRSWNYTSDSRDLSDRRDFSDRSWNYTSDSRDMSQSFTDDRDVTYAIDAGAVKSAFDFADNLSDEALRTGLSALRDAQDTTRAANAESVAFARSAFDRMGATLRDAFSFADTFGAGALDVVNQTDKRGQAITSSAIATVERAYTDAKGEGVAARYAVFGALAVAALAVAIPIMRKG